MAMGAACFGRERNRFMEAAPALNAWNIEPMPALIRPAGSVEVSVFRKRSAITGGSPIKIPAIIALAIGRVTLPYGFIMPDAFLTSDGSAVPRFVPPVR